jgi:hypothetical protein
MSARLPALVWIGFDLLSWDADAPIIVASFMWR